MIKRLMVLVPHPDDDTLSLWPAMHYLACGYEVHFIFLTRGEVTPASLKLDPDPTHYSPVGQPVCAWPDHGYPHDPTRELFTLPTTDEIGLMRLHEGISALGAMAAISPVAGLDPGVAYWHDENLGTNYGCDHCGSSTAPVTETAIALVDAIIRRYVDEFPNSIWWSMSPSDHHPDHRAAGIALRRLKGDPVYNSVTKTFTFAGGDPLLAPVLTGANFFASKLYWGDATHPRDPELLAEYCGWYPNVYPDNTKTLARNTSANPEYTNWLKTKVLKAYTAWDPANGSFAIGGGHSVPAQFTSCFGPSIAVASALWHP